MKDYYVYLHRKATTGEVFYVEKGTGSRAFQVKGRRSEYWFRISKKYGHTVEFYATGLQEWYAIELEKELITYYGRENLCNFTDGGDGMSGYITKKETIDKRVEKIKGKKRPDHVVEAMVSANSKKVICSNGIEFKSGSEATRWVITNINKKASKSAIYLSCNSNGIFTAYGLSWCWKESNKNPIYLGKAISKKIKVINDIGMIFYSITKAAEWLKSIGFEKANPGCICASCRSENKKSYGYKWNYYEK